MLSIAQSICMGCIVQAPYTSWIVLLFFSTRSTPLQDIFISNEARDEVNMPLS
ncbi:hypothetical protein Plhal304r1_c006g0022831 [Plasmopara halstedii]